MYKHSDGSLPRIPKAQKTRMRIETGSHWMKRFHSRRESNKKTGYKTSVRNDSRGIHKEFFKWSQKRNNSNIKWLHEQTMIEIVKSTWKLSLTFLTTSYMQIKKYTEIPSSYRNVLDISGQAKLLLNQDTTIFFCITFSSTRSQACSFTSFWPLFSRAIYVVPPVNPDEHSIPAMPSFPLHTLPLLSLFNTLTPTYPRA